LLCSSTASNAYLLGGTRLKGVHRALQPAVGCNVQKRLGRIVGLASIRSGSRSNNPECSEAFDDEINDMNFFQNGASGPPVGDFNARL